MASSCFLPCSVLVAVLVLFSVNAAEAAIREYQFDVQMTNVTRLCSSKSIVTVNGQFPGPTVFAHEGDLVVVRVVNHVPYNMSIHWHGIRQLRSGWADGPAYITQCPIQSGQSYVYKFTITGQRGTLWWHAHISWLRATVYGPIVILPKPGVPYPFPAPHKEVPIMFGEWWKADTEAVISQALQTGGGPNVSDAFTINGLPGPLYNCSAKELESTASADSCSEPRNHTAMAASSALPGSLLMAALMLLSSIIQAQGITRHYDFNVTMANVTRLCGSKSIITVNGQYPGPQLVAREGDRVVVRVTNHVQHNISLHWHGIRQLRTGWADGPAYITQCPIQTGQSYVYNFTITGQRGTLWWHAHISWLRATVYGALVILPKAGVPYPFPAPDKEVPVIFGEWWMADTETIISQATKTGGAPNVSDAYTINGLPGPLYNCSAKGYLLGNLTEYI
ncbi:hypothetical protein EJB05_18738 [Eragrostis curvula]|uniref:Laccase n=1 Tax=Eragrostis curvula TaxID=38414 RepID=A0A5J9VMH6_9POAL|nr:hypothetical protein EJB05_18738 [Eragrostis curvula]